MNTKKMTAIRFGPSSRWRLPGPLRWGRRSSIRGAAAMAISLAMLSGCNLLTPIVNPLTSAVLAIDSATEQITAASGSWQTVLQDTVKQLTADAQSTVRNEIQTLLDNSIAAVQVGVMCTTDFVGRRVLTVLQEIKAELLGRPAPTPVPFVCSSSPLAIEFDAWQQSRVPIVSLTGFDLKVPLQVSLVQTGGTTAVPNVLATVSPYQVTINLGATGLHLTPQTQRITVSTVSTAAQPSVELTAINVVQPQPKICQEKDLPPNIPGPISLVPLTRGIGDGEFDGNGPHIKATFVILPVGGGLNYIVTMSAKETNGGATEFRGIGSGTLSLNPPLASGLRILSVNGTLESDVEYTDNNTTNDLIPSNGGPISQFLFVGDTDGDDFGKTRLLSANFRPLGLHVVETLNCVSRSEAQRLVASGKMVTPALIKHLQEALKQ
jgi:hypothetical protein